MTKFQVCLVHVQFHFGMCGEKEESVCSKLCSLKREYSCSRGGSRAGPGRNLSPRLCTQRSAFHCRPHCCREFARIVTCGQLVGGTACCGCLPLILPCSQPYFPLSLKIHSRLFRKIPLQGSPQVCPPQVQADLIAKQQKADGRDACHDPGHRKYPTFTPTVASKGSASSPHIPPRPT